MLISENNLLLFSSKDSRIISLVDIAKKRSKFKRNSIEKIKKLKWNIKEVCNYFKSKMTN